MFQGSSDAATASSSAVTASVQSDTVPATSSDGIRRGGGRGRGPGRGCALVPTARAPPQQAAPPQVDNDVDWNWQKATFTRKDIPFTGASGPSAAAQNCITPADFFSLFFTDSVIDNLVVETNRYAEQSRNEKPSAMSWKPVDRDDMTAFIGLTIAMGVCDLPEIHDYWSTEPALEMSWYRSVMPRDRFTQILRYLHCSDKKLALPRTDPQYDKLHKIRPVLGTVLENCKAHYIPAEHISIDEQMIGTRCRVGFIQYMPNKPQRFGIKVWALADSRNAYLCNFQIYTGKHENTMELGLSYRAVYDLTQPYLNNGYKLYTDNFYTSPKLAKDLLVDGTYLTGTVRTNRKGFPKDLVGEKLDKNVSVFLHCDGITAVHWKDKRDVFCLSSLHGNEIETVKNKNDDEEEKSKPKMICDYNTNMGGVDLHDQLQVYYSIGRKGMKWWRRVFWRLCEISVLNSFVLHNLVHGKSRQMTQKKFRLQLAYSLTEAEISKRANPPDTSDSCEDLAGLQHPCPDYLENTLHTTHTSDTDAEYVQNRKKPSDWQIQGH